MIGCLILASPTWAERPQYLTIATAGITGVYYAVGGAISKIINDQQKRLGFRVSVEPTAGSIFNVDELIKGEYQFALVQSDVQSWAVKGEKFWKEKGAVTKLRSIAALHLEAVTLLATDASGIKSVQGLRGKRVAVGELGSGNHENALEILESAGLTPGKDLMTVEGKQLEINEMLAQGKIDAFFCTVGHPSGSIAGAVSGNRKVHFVPIELTAALQKKTYFVPSRIYRKDYPAVTNVSDVPTVAVKAIWVTSSDVPEKTVYAVTKEIFQNWTEFQDMHPALKSIERSEIFRGLIAPLHPGAIQYYQEAKFANIPLTAPAK